VIALELRDDVKAMLNKIEDEENEGIFSTMDNSKYRGIFRTGHDSARQRSLF
jgi:hypothetical protein